MKLGTVTKFDKKNKTVSQKFVTMTPLSFFPFMANSEESRRIVCKNYIFINNNLFSYEN